MITAAIPAPVVGASAASRTYGPISRTDIVRYAGASGDFNPIHHDEDYAREAGFSTVFAMGMFPAGLLATFATDWLGAEHIQRFRVRVEAQVWPGDELTCRGTVVSVQQAEAGVTVEVELRCTRQAGEVAVSGSAIFVLPEMSPRTTRIGS